MNGKAVAPVPDTGVRHFPSLSEAARVWATIALLSFGGPAGQIAVMHRVLVEERRWISETRFLHALNFCMLLPGPEAQQLATYIGWLMHRVRGGLLAGGLFILPGVVSIMALSYVYAAYGQTGIVAALFFGVKAAVLAIVLEAVVRIGRRALRGPALTGLAAFAFIGIFFLNIPFPIVVIGSALIGYAGSRLGWTSFDRASADADATADRDSLLGDAVPDHAHPDRNRALLETALGLLVWLAPIVTLVVVLGGDNIFALIAVFFSKMAVVTFGGAYAVLSYVAQQAVDAYHWLTPSEMLDGLGMAETTPGPLIMVVQFVAFMAAFRVPGALPPMVAGTLGGLLATWVTFVPCFLWIFVGGPYIERLRGRRALGAALSAITAAVVGVILNLAVWFAIHTFFGEIRNAYFGFFHVDLPIPATLNPWAVILSLGAIVAVFRLKLGVLPTLAASSAAGIALYFLGAI